MSHCQICMNPGHEAWKLPSGNLVCPMKIEDAMKRPSPATVAPRTNSVEFTMTIAEAVALRTLLGHLGQGPDKLSLHATSEIRSLLTRLWAVEAPVPAGYCGCRPPTRGITSFHCGTCGRVLMLPDPTF
jgi:hypothetical protein